MNHFGWVSARSLPQAASEASSTVADAMTEAMGLEPAVIKAGGVDLLDLMEEGLLAPKRVVSLQFIPELNVLQEDEQGALRVGSMVTLARLVAEAVIQQRYPAFAEALHALANPQVLGFATLGGNLLQRPRCGYFRAEQYRCLRKGGSTCFAIEGDNRCSAIFNNQICAMVHPSTAATLLVALSANVELVDASGCARRLLLEDFFVAPERDVTRENDLHPHEILTAIVLPKPAVGACMAHAKQNDDASFDWPLAEVAVVLDLAEDGRCRDAAIVLGAAAPVPYRARAACAVLIGRTIDDAAARAAAQAALEGATPLDKNAYKAEVFATLVYRTVLAAAARRNLG